MKVITSRVIQGVLLVGVFLSLLRVMSVEDRTEQFPYMILAGILFVAYLAVNLRFNKCPNCKRHHRYWSSHCPYCGEEIDLDGKV